MATDTTVNNLIINKLTKEQYEAIANPSVTELYLIPDEIDDAPTSGSENPVTSDGIYSALEDKQDTLVSGTNIKTVNNTSLLGTGNVSVGDVTGPSSSTNAHVAVFDGTTGKAIKDGTYTISKSVPSDAVFTDTTYESKSASSGGTAVSLVTTGEKYTWNNKQAALVGSGTGQNVKTVNNNSIVGSGNISVGDVTGPSSSTDSHVATFNGTGGKTIKDSGYTIGKSVPSDAVFTDTTYESKTAVSGGTAVSLCTTGEKYTWNNKQAALVSGTNIKTINSISLLGSGNISVQPTLVGSGTGQNIKTINSTSIMGSGDITVQPTLVSGTNIKTINNESILGSGNITIQGGGGITGTGVTAIVALTESEYEALTTKSETTIYIVTPDPVETNYVKVTISGGTRTVDEVGSGWDISDLTNDPPVLYCNDALVTNITYWSLSGNSLYANTAGNPYIFTLTNGIPTAVTVSFGGGGD